MLKKFFCRCYYEETNGLEYSTKCAIPCAANRKIHDYISKGRLILLYKTKDGMIFKNGDMEIDEDCTFIGYLNH